MIFYFLGIITGLIFSLIIILIILHYQAPIRRQLYQLKNLTGLKGEIIEPENEELSNWIDNLPKQ